MAEITLYNRTIPYSIIRSPRAKRLRIAVYCNCDVVVTLPHHRTVSDVEVYLKEKSKWISEKLDYFRTNRSIKIGGKLVNFEENQKEAHKLALRIIKKFNKIYAFKYNKITIKNLRTKWGSCSKKGNLNFNYRIIFLPRHLAEYIVVHELCHLRELSHSRKYWNLVERALPNYKELVKELKRNY